MPLQFSALTLLAATIKNHGNNNTVFITDEDLTLVEGGSIEVDEHSELGGYQFRFVPVQEDTDDQS